jgi:hypothetical protein
MGLGSIEKPLPLAVIGSRQQPASEVASRCCRARSRHRVGEQELAGFTSSLEVVVRGTPE